MRTSEYKNNFIMAIINQMEKDIDDDDLDSLDTLLDTLLLNDNNVTPFLDYIDDDIKKSWKLE